MQGDLFCQHWITVLSREAIIQFPTDFMIYSMFQGLTKHLAGTILPIYCW